MNPTSWPGDDRPQATQRPDIQTEADIRLVVDDFYTGIERDPTLGRYFGPLDMATHLPRMYAFWSNVLFATGGFKGNPFLKHAALEGLERAHFIRWLDRFEVTVDAHFAGPTADLMKTRAAQIAGTFQLRLGLLTPADAGLIRLL